MLNSIKKLIPPLVLLLVLGGGYYFWNRTQTSDLPTGFASGNGRIEATEVDISALTGGRIAEITAAEGDFVKAGDMLVQMDVVQMNAQKRQAEAQLRRAQIGVETAGALVAQAEAQERAEDLARGACSRALLHGRDDTVSETRPRARLQRAPPQRLRSRTVSCRLRAPRHRIAR